MSYSAIRCLCQKVQFFCIGYNIVAANDIQSKEFQTNQIISSYLKSVKTKFDSSKEVIILEETNHSLHCILLQLMTVVLQNVTPVTLIR